jgi:hypothetical protein
MYQVGSSCGYADSFKNKSNLWTFSIFVILCPYLIHITASKSTSISHDMKSEFKILLSHFVLFLFQQKLHIEWWHTVYSQLSRIMEEGMHG